MSTLSVTDAAREVPRRPALVDDAATLTWTELADEVVPRARDLEGQRAVVLAPRADRASVVALLAAIEAGVPAVLLHPRLTDTERAAQRALAATDLDPATLAVVFTSGTTGRPRGVELSRAAFAAAARLSEANLGWRDDDRWLLCLPPAHVGGLSIATRCLLARQAIVLAPASDPDTLVEAIARHRVTLVSLVPAQLERLFAARPAWRPPPQLRAVLLGGAAARPALVAEAVRRGVPLRVTYGLSEACSQVATQGEHDPPGTLRPLPGVEVRVVDGVIEVRSPALLSGTLPRGAASVGGDGWLRTGDRGLLRADGTLVVLGRADDVIVTGGENVDPLEVENVLDACPGVARALVFAVPDATWGQLVGAAVVPDGTRDAAELAREVAAFAAGRLAPHKRPRRLACVDELPLTAAGKPDRATAAVRLRSRLQRLD